MRSLFRKILALVAYTFAVVVVSVLITIIIVISINNQNAGMRENVTRDVVLERISKGFFAVTRTVYLDEEVKIDVQRASDWDEFLWGKSINASARVRADVGVDLEKLTRDDIEVSESQKLITIRLPKAEILDISLTEKLVVDTEGTILTRLFDSDRNTDYKLAQAELISTSRNLIAKDEQLLKEAAEGLEPVLGALVYELDYKIKIITAQ